MKCVFDSAGQTHEQMAEAIVSTTGLRIESEVRVASLEPGARARAWLTGVLAGAQGVLLATPAHIGGFIAGLLLQRPLLLWKYRKA